MNEPDVTRTPVSAKTPRRIEGKDKVTGYARYTNDLDGSIAGCPPLHGFVVQSEIAAGSICRLDTLAAEHSLGVQAVLTHENAPRLKPVKTLTGSELDLLLPLQSDRVCYYGQAIALVIADTLPNAQYAASLIRTAYQERPLLHHDWRLAAAAPTKKMGAGQPASSNRGRPAEQFDSSPVQVDASYETEPAHHNAMEPGAAMASWGLDGTLTIWNSTQFVYGDATTLGQAFGFSPCDTKLRMLPYAATGIDIGGRVRAIAPLVGGAFGSKDGRALLILAALGAKVAGAPLKVALTRKQTFSLMPYRSALRQRVRLGAQPDGKLRACLHDSLVQNSRIGSFVEPSGELTRSLYSCPHVATTHSVARLDINAPGWMRAPGAAPGLFALESAMDELAVKLNLDPLELRLRNYAHVDPDDGKPWSSKSLRECYRMGAEHIGWQARSPSARSMHRDGLLVGYGMATAAHRNVHFPAVARIELTHAGDAVVGSAAHDFGQGAITALTQIASESLGIPYERVRFEFGDTRLPFSFLSAGSATTLSVGSAIQKAAEKLKQELILRAVTDRNSPLHGLPRRAIQMQDGALFDAGDPDLRENVGALLARHRRRTFAAKAATGQTFGRSSYSRTAFGAQFAEVTVDPETGRIRVMRLVGAFACGRVVNPLLAESQLRGGMIWGLGQALLEESVIDPHLGSWVNPNLAEALVPTHADVPHVEALMIEENDRRGSRLGVKGLGEIGITGVAAAIANAVYHATGKRVRRLPIRLDALLY